VSCALIVGSWTMGCNTSRGVILGPQGKIFG
jgi:hypothetical protein